MSTTQHSIALYAGAGYPAVAIATSDEDRAIASVLGAIPDSKLNQNRKFWKIAAAGGLQEWQQDPQDKKWKWVSIDKAAGYSGCMSKITAAPEYSVLIMLDFQHVIKTQAMYRQLRDSLLINKAIGTMIVLISPSWKIPPELEHDIPVINEALPTREELNGPLNVILESVSGTVDAATKEALLDAASGLTLGEAESAMALAWNGTSLVPSVVANEKMKQVRQSGYLEVTEPVSPADLGGLGNLRDYITAEVIPNIHDRQLACRGLGFVGVPGSGKSLGAKVIGAMLGWPVVRCDIAALMTSKVGASQQAILEVLKIVEAVSPCLLFFDEIDKGLGGVASSAQSDGGTLLGMFGSLCTWLNDHQKQILTVFTCNDYSKLPPEFSRAGRFDGIWFMNFPPLIERLEIATIHLRRFGATGKIPELSQHIAELSNDWTGAEIEQLVKKAASRTRRKITIDVLTECASEIRPISITQKTAMDALRQFGSGLKHANTPEAAVAVGSRKVRR